MVTALMLCAAGSGCSTKPVQLRILSYNIHHGEGIDGRFDLPRLARVISRANPDLVALQEVDQGTHRAHGVDQAAELGRLTGLHAVFGQAMPYQGGSYGEAVLSRWPILGSTNHALPNQPGSEPRAALEIRVRPPGTSQIVRFIGTHLDHQSHPTDRLEQSAQILRALEHADEPILLVGDLNAEKSTAEIRQLFDGGFVDLGPRACTYPSETPEIRIDYVLARPANQWVVVEQRVLDERVASDHRPILVVLELINQTK